MTDIADFDSANSSSAAAADRGAVGVVYLDQFVYINLARASLGLGHKELLPVREDLLAARMAGQLYFPLSQVH